MWNVRTWLEPKSKIYIFTWHCLYRSLFLPLIAKATTILFDWLIHRNAPLSCCCRYPNMLMLSNFHQHLVVAWLLDSCETKTTHTEHGVWAEEAIIAEEDYLLWEKSPRRPRSQQTADKRLNNRSSRIYTRIHVDKRASRGSDMCNWITKTLCIHRERHQQIICCDWTR